MTRRMAALRYVLGPLVLGAIGFVVVRYGWDPHPVPHSCPSGAPSSSCFFAVGVLGQGLTGFFIGVVTGLVIVLGLGLAAHRHRYRRVITAADSAAGQDLPPSAEGREVPL